MNSEDLLELAQKIYALDVILHPDWDLQKKARESFKTAMQFFLAAQAEQADSSNWIATPEKTDSHPANSIEMAQPDMSSSAPLPPPDSTRDRLGGSRDPALTVAIAEAERQSKELRASRGSSQRGSQEQSSPPSRGVQVANPYAPLR